jgi:hypothetical protein
MMRVSATGLRDWGTLVFLALALSVCAFYVTAAIAPLNPANLDTFVPSHFEGVSRQEVRQEWRPRVLSSGAAELVSNAVWAAGARSPGIHLMTTVGLYSALWLLLTNAVLLWGLGRRALFVMWGVFAAVVFGYCPALIDRVYPWDMPSLFFFAAFVACYHRRVYKAIPVVILLGLFFKETTAVLCLSFLFLDVPMRERLRYFVVTAALFVIAKVAVDLAVRNPMPFFSMTAHQPHGGAPRITANLRTLVTAYPANPVFINAGTLLALAVVPGRSRTLAMVRWIAIAFAVSTFFFGMVNEYRIWFELAPLAVYALACRFEAGGPEAAGADERLPNDAPAPSL